MPQSERIVVIQNPLFRGIREDVRTEEAIRAKAQQKRNTQARVYRARKANR